MNGLVLMHKVEDGAILRLKPETVRLVDEIISRVSDDAKMVEFLTQLRGLKGETRLIDKRPVKILYDFPSFVQVYRTDLDKRIQEEREEPA